jgi:hypothetical protein
MACDVIICLNFVLCWQCVLFGTEIHWCNVAVLRCDLWHNKLFQIVIVLLVFHLSLKLNGAVYWYSVVASDVITRVKSIVWLLLSTEVHWCDVLATILRLMT